MNILGGHLGKKCSVAVMKNKNNNKEFGTLVGLEQEGVACCGRPDIWGHISSGEICPFQTG